ncbi:MAG: hypothetical protein ACJAZ1_001204 [Yoonia sp.]|jgi:hypothetical protein
MNTNVGTIDRVFRAVLGVIFLIAPFVSGLTIFESGVATTVSAAIGIIMVATAAMKFCPLYAIFGLRTCQK